MDIIMKGKHLYTLEKYLIYKTSKNILQMNDTNLDTHNPTFKTLQETNTRWQYAVHHAQKQSQVKGSTQNQA